MQKRTPIGVRFYLMSLPLALCQWRRNSKLQVHKKRYHGLLAPARLPADGGKTSRGKKVTRFSRFVAANHGPTGVKPGGGP